MTMYDEIQSDSSLAVSLRKHWFCSLHSRNV